MSDDVRSSTSFLQPLNMDTGMSTSSLMLTCTKYHHWAMRMEVTLEAHEFLGVIDGIEENHKKDLLALLMIFNSISKSQSSQKDIKKSDKGNWEVHRKVYVGMDHVVQATVQTLKREFEIISMKRNEKVDG